MPAKVLLVPVTSGGGVPARSRRLSRRLSSPGPVAAASLTWVILLLTALDIAPAHGLLLAVGVFVALQTAARGRPQRTLWSRDSQWITRELRGKVGVAAALASIPALVPQLGHVRLRELTAVHVERLYASMRAESARRVAAGEGQTEPATIRRVHATLMSALNSAVKRRLLAYNPAQHVELEAADRPEVEPWSAAELGAFLDAAASDRLAALYELMARRSAPRRGARAALGRRRPRGRRAARPDDDH